MNWKTEIITLVKYLGSGVINTIIGFTTIFVLMALNTEPYTANAIGYLAGLSVGFFLARRFVFCAKGDLLSQGWKYITAFLVSYCINMLALYVCLTALGLNKYLSQFLATGAYVGSMYPLSRWFVFTKKRN